MRFESSDGIQAKKTEVLYKGIAVGKVVALDVSEDIKGVVATIEMDKEARQYLSKVPASGWSSRGFPWLASPAWKPWSPASTSRSIR